MIKSQAVCDWLFFFFKEWFDGEVDVLRCHRLFQATGRLYRRKSLA